MRFLDKFKKQAQDLPRTTATRSKTASTRLLRSPTTRRAASTPNQIDSGADKAKDVVDGLGGDNE